MSGEQHSPMDETTSHVNSPGYVSDFLLLHILEDLIMKENYSNYFVFILAGLIEKETMNSKIPTTTLSFRITQYNYNNMTQSSSVQIENIRTLQVLEICVKNQKKFSRDEHFWTFLKDNISLALHPSIMENQQKTINREECIVWLYQSKITTTIEMFKSSIQKLNRDMNYALLQIKNTYMISCELLCIFWYLQFKQMDQFIEVLQNILGRAWTFKCLSKIYIRNFRLKLKRKRSLLQNQPITELLIELFHEPGLEKFDSSVV